MDNIPDRRAEFYNVLWQQGKLLLTKRTENWTKASKDKIDFDERHCVFANFSARDEGRSRIFLYRFDSPEECEKAVQAHNLSLRIVR